VEEKGKSRVEDFHDESTKHLSSLHQDYISLHQGKDSCSSSSEQQKLVWANGGLGIRSSSSSSSSNGQQKLGLPAVGPGWSSATSDALTAPTAGENSACVLEWLRICVPVPSVHIISLTINTRLVRPQTSLAAPFSFSLQSIMGQKVQAAEGLGL